MTIYFVSLISRENQPLYIQPFSPFEEKEESKDKNKDISFVDEGTRENELLKYNFLSHMALDVFDSPFMPMAETEPRPGRTYRLLFVQDSVFVFGQETNTGLKIVVGGSRDENEYNKQETGLNEVFKQIYRAYLRLICNPFIDSEKIDDEIESTQFDRRIKEIVKSWNTD
ncbi:hypothetical protein FOA43_002259 [Brettanomyces nanus]|uniref:Uncharacterized protein n=1 Tax=Eeniella nana TaxID=13502 RepID=A0A875RZG0_EENNA|nr:uncharacterized protein FOA43_002259 [Brettanomyces nanus]QPG74921.1 hypothetical protein FOA43_002259 [Brettanomyces nanus]